MDIVLDREAPALRAGDMAGDMAGAQVLRDGRPLPDFAVQLQHAASASASGIWLKTDAQGRLQVRLPQPGWWLLRGIDIRPSEATPDGWETRFATLAFEAVEAGVGAAGGVVGAVPAAEPTRR